MTQWFTMSNSAHRWRNKILLTIFIMISGWLMSVSGMYSYSLNDRENEVVTLLLKQPETRYFGFYSLNLPQDFIPTGMIMFIHGVEMTPVETKLQYFPPFQQFLLLYEERLKNKNVLDPQDAPYLKQVYPLKPPLKGRIFERMKAEYTPDFARVLEAWKWEDGVTFSVSMNANDGRAVRYDGERKIAKYSYGYDVPEKKSQLLTLLSAFQPRKDNQQPFINKLAIQYGQVDVSTLGQYELSVSYRNSREVTITLKTDNDSYIGTLLLDKDPRVIEMESGETLYKGKREINGLNASEWWVKQKITNTEDPTLTYIFHLLLNEGRTGNSKPLKLRMSYRVDLLNSDGALTEHELVALWQAVTETFKYYPPQL